MTKITSVHVAAAQRIIAAAGQAGGIDEVRKIAKLGWPENRPLDDDSPALRAAIIREAKWVVAGVDQGES